MLILGETLQHGNDDSKFLFAVYLLHALRGKLQKFFVCNFPAGRATVAEMSKSSPKYEHTRGRHTVFLFTCVKKIINIISNRLETREHLFIPSL